MTDDNCSYLLITDSSIVWSFFTASQYADYTSLTYISKSTPTLEDLLYWSKLITVTATEKVICYWC